MKEDKRERRVGNVLLARTIRLDKTAEYQKYCTDKVKHKETLCRLIESRKGDRYFFLPGTPFIANSIVDFQDKTMVSYEDLNNFERVAKLDSPFAESMTSSFIRYYNRIGYPDIDSEFVLQSIK